MSKTVTGATIKTDKGDIEVSPEQLRKLMDADARERRKGNHVADGIMWCPNCGGQTVTNGHQTCKDCDPTLPLSTAEYMELKSKEKTPADKAEAEPLEVDEEVEEEISGESESDEGESETEG